MDRTGNLSGVWGNAQYMIDDGWIDYNPARARVERGMLRPYLMNLMPTRSQDLPPEPSPWVRDMLESYVEMQALVPPALRDVNSQVPCRTVYCETGLRQWEGRGVGANQDGRYYHYHPYPLIVANGSEPERSHYFAFHESMHHLMQIFKFTQRPAFEAIVDDHPAIADDILNVLKYGRDKLYDEALPRAVDDYLMEPNAMLERYRPVINYWLQVIVPVVAKLPDYISSLAGDVEEVTTLEYHAVMLAAEKDIRALEATLDVNADVAAYRNGVLQLQGLSLAEIAVIGKGADECDRPIANDDVYHQRLA